MPMVMSNIGPMDPRTARRFDEYVKRMDTRAETQKEIITRLVNKNLILEAGLIDVQDSEVDMSSLAGEHVLIWVKNCLAASKLSNPTPPPIPRSPGEYQ